VLRLAVAELFYFTEVPFKVVIDEAVELAKTYGTDESGRFVNGILDSIHKEGRGEKETLDV
jgi:N utilization substance protein B